MDAIGHYNLLERIGSGGLGETYRARDTRVGRTVALKVVTADVATNPEHRARLLDEARIAAALSHPNISALFDTGEADGHVYLAYEYAPGRPLREEMAGGPMNPRRALELAVQLADGVADAHAHGIIHGDLRPETIIVTPKGSAKILDFGFAQWTRGGMIRMRAARNPDAQPADSAKVLAYLSPEQALGGAIDARTDVFSLGILTFEMLTGRNPFLAATPSDTVVNVIQGRIPSASDTNSIVPVEADAVVSRALARDLAERYQSMASLAAELRRVGGADLEQRSAGSPDPAVLLPLDEQPDKTPAAGLLVVAVASALAAAAIMWWWLSKT